MLQKPFASVHVLIQRVVAHNHFLQVLEVVVVEGVDAEEEVVVVAAEGLDGVGVVDEAVVAEDEEVNPSYLNFTCNLF